MVTYLNLTYVTYIYMFFKKCREITLNPFASLWTPVSTNHRFLRDADARTSRGSSGTFPWAPAAAPLIVAGLSVVN